MQEAVVRALSSWPARGAPDSAEAWLVTVAANAHRDRVRRGRSETPDALERLAEMSPWVRVAVGEPDVVRGWNDELLRLVFACCHPALEPGESAALCLATVVGPLDRRRSPVRSSSNRVRWSSASRGRASGSASGATPRARHRSAARDRLDAVLRVIHLLFNEGYWSGDDDAPIRGDLCRLAIGLSRSLADGFSDEPEVLALLALVLLHDARRPARLDGEGRVVPLPEQDRSRWDQAAIAHAMTILDTALALGRPGPLQIEAAISATHCRAARAEETDWVEIAALYHMLEAHRPTPAVRVNRAFAVARAEGLEAGLALLDEAGAYPYVHLVRGTLLAELGRIDEARASLVQACAVARNRAERIQLEAQLARLDGRPSQTPTGPDLEGPRRA